uniref:Uncharacterized protein n=1 Tax=Candidatus Kentrum eta TaxID=2126337 RepID=A0A450U9B4_9GAMM|nr:MAG: hypothetical protein BECKH772A_GA0070896_1001014 [Candidatus Kentron sp. H]VFJ90706.1 MAG: hypothetical protein BECKH772B_GA0070898_1001114 [Candidatus Kentron sp. H]VFJ96865.1 MAG: hypothetical protein BECKH772C_GA0070978_1000914 [Candidatus Kentron sp. H]
MNLKEIIEGHPVRIYFMVLFIGFSAGLATYQAILEFAKLIVISQERLEKLEDNPVITRRLFSMEPHKEKTLSFFLESEGMKVGNILFLFSNAPCGESSPYDVHLSWGSHLSKKVPVPCAEDRHIVEEYFTGFGGGNDELDVVFTSGANAVEGAGVRILRGEEGRKFPW